MDKWERVARSIAADRWGYTNPVIGRKIQDALRMCEADTIRRCADEVATRADDADSEGRDGTAYDLRQMKKGILSLLPKEPGQ